MFFNKKKSDATKAFELCVEIYGIVNDLSRKVNDIYGFVQQIGLTQEKAYEQISAENGAAFKAIKTLGGEILGEFKALGERIGSYESGREDAVTAAQILDEYLNGAKEGSAQ